MVDIVPVLVNMVNVGTYRIKKVQVGHKEIYILTFNLPCNMSVVKYFVSTSLISQDPINEDIIIAEMQAAFDILIVFVLK